MITVIKVEGLGKKYIIRHEGRYKYNALRDEITESLKAIGRGLLKPQMYSTKQKRSLEEFWALKDVSFEVKQGDSIAIIGKNGAGKSTLLKLLSRITEPTEGKISLVGRVGSLLEVGTGFHPELTGTENIFLNGAILGMAKSDIKKRFDEIVCFAGVEKFLDTPVKRYSSGMQVRLAFAVAAHLEPEILLVDEVLAVGDHEFQKKCLGKMSEIAGEGRTVIFVSHNMAAVGRLCNKGVLLGEGGIIKIGEVENVIKTYMMSGNEKNSSVLKISNDDCNKTACITYVKLFNEFDQPAYTFDIGEIWKVVLEFELTENYSHVIAEVILKSLNGYRVATFWSRPKDLSAGCYYVEFIVDFPLNSGEIDLDVYLSSREQAICYHENIGNVLISELSVWDVPPFRVKDVGVIATKHIASIEELLD